MEFNQQSSSYNDFFLNFYTAKVATLSVPVLQIRWRSVKQQGLQRIFLYSNSFFNLLVPPRCSFLTMACHYKPFLPTTFSCWWNNCWSEQQPFRLNVFGCIRKLSELRWYYWMQTVSLLLCPSKPTIWFSKSQTTCWISCLAKVSKVARNILPYGDQLTIQHFASLERACHV